MHRYFDALLTSFVENDIRKSFVHAMIIIISDLYLILFIIENALLPLSSDVSWYRDTYGMMH